MCTDVLLMFRYVTEPCLCVRLSVTPKRKSRDAPQPWIVVTKIVIGTLKTSKNRNSIPNHNRPPGRERASVMRPAWCLLHARRRGENGTGCLPFDSWRGVVPAENSGRNRWMAVILHWRLTFSCPVRKLPKLSCVYCCFLTEIDWNKQLCAWHVILINDVVWQRHDIISAYPRLC